MKKLLYFTFFIYSININSQLAITEFMVNPTGTDTPREWVEIYNYSGTPINLRNWELVVTSTTTTYNVPLSTSDLFIAANDYAIIARNKSTFETEWFGGVTNPKVLDYSSLSFPLVNNDGMLALTYNNGLSVNTLFEISYRTDVIEGQSYFLEDTTLWPGKYFYEYQINGAGNDTLIEHLGSLVISYPIGYENNVQSGAITASNGDSGTPLSGGYTSNSAPLNSCANPETILCGQTVAGDNSSVGINNIYNYDCAPQNEYGYEMFYTFTLSQLSDVNITITGLTADLDIQLLSSPACDGTTCLDRDDNTINYTALAAGTYYIVVDGFGSSASQISSYNLNLVCTPVTTDINTISSSQISLYPNPSNGILNISNNSNSIINTINVYSLSGQKQLSISNPKIIDLNELSNGLYLVECVTNNGKVIKKINLIH